ncbi:G-protein alpha subunit-domain-containing protein [Xylariaceae sp. FL1651]|nr:G-protein alpha subunit-domain-containing protein [Xylariaceae sp. FL1651]
MDPVTIVQIVGTVVSLGDVVLRCITTLSSLKSKYSDAPLLISTVVGQLYMVQAALDRLSALDSPTLSREPRFRQLARQIGNALDSFSPLIKHLEETLDICDNTAHGDTMSAKSRITFLWKEGDLMEFSTLLDRQVNALNLLLQAIQCHTWTQQQEMIERDDSQSVIMLAKDCASSLRCLCDGSSSVTDKATAISLRFEFDPIVLSSQLYQTAHKGYLRRLLQASRPSKDSRLVQSDHTTAQFSSNLEEPSVTAEPQSQEHNVSQGLMIPHDQPKRPSSSAPSQHVARSVIASFLGGLNTVIFSSRNPRLSLSRRATSRRRPEWHQDEQIFAQVLQMKTPAPTTATTAATAATEVPVMLAGIHYSGKSTLLKSLLLATQPDYFDKDRKGYSSVIRENTINSILQIIDVMDGKRGQMEHVEGKDAYIAALSQEFRNCLHNVEADDFASQKVAWVIKLLWGYGEVQNIYHKERGIYEMHDNIAYYIEAFDRLAAAGYVPTNADIMRASPKTIGVYETPLVLRNSNYTIIDVGGTRASRKNWAFVMPFASTVLYTIDTTAYYHDTQNTGDNGMTEQLLLFDTLVNGKWLMRSNFILVFTKMDLLQDCLNYHDPQHYFAGAQHYLAELRHYFTDLEKVDWQYLRTAEGYMQYLEAKFLGLIRSTEIRDRTRVIRCNLVDVEAHNPGVEVIDTLQSLTASYPDMKGIKPRR